MKAAPTPNEVEDVFQKLIRGSLTRDQADRWAAQWYGKESAPMPSFIWDALGQLHGCDLREGPEEPYLHSEEQIKDWLLAFQKNRRSSEG